eukprot:1390697-Rhodomonas_salina.3
MSGMEERERWDQQSEIEIDQDRLGRKLVRESEESNQKLVRESEESNQRNTNTRDGGRGRSSWRAASYGNNRPENGRRRRGETSSLLSKFLQHVEVLVRI